MPIHSISDLESHRLDAYRSLKTTNLTRVSGRFIAESKPLVQRLIASELVVESVLVDAKYFDEAQSWLPMESDILVVQSQMVSELIGFNFHRGFLACGLRSPARSVGEHLICPDAAWMGVLVIGVQDPENMGSILRSCAALGISDILIGPECVDPFARRVLRVSMGNAFKQRFFDCPHPVRSLEECRDKGIESVAACLAENSVELREFRRKGPTLLILGNEAHGLPPDIQSHADRCVRIDMELGTDSLNVSVAAGILIHHLRRVSTTIAGNLPNLEK